MKKIILALVAIFVSGLASAGTHATLAEQINEQEQLETKKKAAEKEVYLLVTKCSNNIEEPVYAADGSLLPGSIKDPIDSIVWEPIAKKIQLSTRADGAPYWRARNKMFNQILKIVNQSGKLTPEFLNQSPPLTPEQALSFFRAYQDEIRAQGGEVQAVVEPMKFDPHDPVVRDWLSRTVVFNEIKSKTQNGKLACTSQMVSEANSTAEDVVAKIESCTGLPIKTLPLLIGATSLVCDEKLFTVFVSN